MADLLVVTFKGRDDARRALEDVRRTQHAGGLSVKDAAVVEKDDDGKLHHVNQVDTATKTGVVGGGFLGLLIGFVFFPVIGLALGAIAGGLIGKSLHHDVDKQLIKDVTDDLTPGTSALFLLVEGSAAALVGVFAPYRGKVYQTTVDPELEAQLNDELTRSGG
jgi:uncharacterized membrane protein